MMIKNEGVFPLLVSPDIDTPVVKTLDITHFEDLCHYIFTGRDKLLMIQATDSFAENNYKPAQLHTSTFNHHERALIDKSTFKT